MIPIYTVDSFTNQPFKGNPAGVCLLEESIPEELMQSIAAELNLSETAFICESANELSIRYFSPLQEIPLCGHATLASAKILFDKKGINQITFTTYSGVRLNCKKVGEKIAMDFPRYPLVAEQNVPQLLVQALGLDGFLEACYNKENNILMLVIKNYESVINISPNFTELVASHDKINGVLVTAKGDSDFDFYSRYFWPWSGNNEDPVTGATHTFMAPYWSEKLGKSTLKSFQASKRTGILDIEIESENQLKILGEAVVIMEGQLSI